MSELGKRKYVSDYVGPVGVRRVGIIRGGTKRGYMFNYARSYRKSGGIPSRYRGTLQRSGYYGRYTRRTQVARLRRGLNIEKKFFDTAISFAVDATGEVPATGQLNLIPQGVTESTRVGRVCQIKSLQMKIQCTYVPGVDTNGVGVMYLYLVQDKQCNGAAAAATDVLTSTDYKTAMINMSNSQRFRILRRWEYTFQSGAGVQTAFGRDVKVINEYVKMNLPLEFSSTTGAITEIKSNNLFLLAGSDAVTDDSINVAGTVRVRFTDI